MGDSVNVLILKKIEKISTFTLSPMSAFFSSEVHTSAETKELTIYSPLVLAALILPTHTASIKNQRYITRQTVFQETLSTSHPVKRS